MADLKIPVPILPKPEEPEHFNRKWIVGLVLFISAILIVMFFNSSLSRLQEIRVEGIDVLSNQEVLDLAGVSKGNSYFVPTVTTIQKRVMSSPVVKTMQVEKSFPGEMVIRIEEFAKVGYQLDSSGVTRVRLSNGTAIVWKTEQRFIDRPLLTGWKDDQPELLLLVRTLSEIPMQHLAEISEIRPFASFAYPEKIKLYTRDGYEVHTTIGYLKKKIGFLRQIILQVEENQYQRGYIELLEADVFRPFSEDVQKNLLNPDN